MAHESVPFWKRSTFDSVVKKMRFHYLFNRRHVNGRPNRIEKYAVTNENATV